MSSNSKPFWIQTLATLSPSNLRSEKSQTWANGVGNVPRDSHFCRTKGAVHKWPVGGKDKIGLGFSLGFKFKSNLNSNQLTSILSQMGDNMGCCWRVLTCKQAFYDEECHGEKVAQGSSSLEIWIQTWIQNSSWFWIQIKSDPIKFYLIRSDWI